MEELVMNNYLVKYEPPEDRSAIDEMMAEPVECLIKWKETRPGSYPSEQRAMESYLDPRNTAGRLLKQLKSPEGNREVVEEIMNNWIIEHLALDRYHQSEILNSELGGGINLHSIQDMYDRKRPNEQTIIGLLTAKKRLLNLPGISFTQVNLAKGPQQINNCPNENEKPKGEI